MDMKLKLALLAALFGVIGSAYAGTYTCDVELMDGSKTKFRGVVANSESQAYNIVKQDSRVKYANCY
jgi:hypothetical protein